MTEEPAAGLSRWRWTITTAFGLGGITVSAWGPRLPAIKAELHIGTATIGLLLAGVTVGAIGALLLSTPGLRGAGHRPLGPVHRRGRPHRGHRPRDGDRDPGRPPCSRRW